MPYRLAIAQDRLTAKVDKGIRTLGLQSHNLARYVLGGIRTPDPRLRRPLLYPAELQAHQHQILMRERVMGIEPTYPAWKAGVLPLNYTRILGLKESG